MTPLILRTDSPLRTLPRQIALATALAAALVVGGAGDALAHVRVKADSTTPGSFSALTFRVPNESDTAGTVAVSVQLPQDTPFLYVSTQPVPGWQVKVTEAALPQPVDYEGTTITKAARTVTWTADAGTQIRPGEYQEFSVSVGPLPAPGTVLLPATQTYSDRTVVRWDEPPTAGSEPEHPAPALVITAASASPLSTQSSSISPTSTVSAADGLGRGLGVAALVVAVAALVVAVLGHRRTGRST